MLFTFKVKVIMSHYDVFWDTSIAQKVYFMLCHNLKMAMSIVIGMKDPIRVDIWRPAHVSYLSNEKIFFI